MALTLRAACAADLPGLRALFLATRREAYPWLEPASLREADLDAQTEGERIWVASAADDALAGFVSLWEPDDFVHHLYVGRAWRRQGVARALLRALPGWPATRYRLKCLRRNAAALAFYRACGFVEIGAGTGEDGDYALLESRGDRVSRVGA
ncbi:GNAT family N-acetyltransferase [Achromobacter xylosoxidans]|uniref:GNAT family N-acetyltransferase n=1 Tax=Alcaligenes xylosoxydans xylosoxydans TaxID=85698 RepID=UPI0022B8AEBE|nr:GNAT family N-acetyltransferase [Achromobacter xylosoxidans]MCZ8389701.1 GNAT family N-acetyltransferase [Achromobacter xylosoxidans]